MSMFEKSASRSTYRGAGMEDVRKPRRLEILAAMSADVERDSTCRLLMSRVSRLEHSDSPENLFSAGYPFESSVPEEIFTSVVMSSMVRRDCTVDGNDVTR